MMGTLHAVQNGSIFPKFTGRLVKVAAIAMLSWSTSAFASSSEVAARCEAVMLDGKSLTLEQVVNVARRGCHVAISAQAAQRLDRSHALLLAYAGQDMPVYGLNRGVGQNKDQTIFKGGEISPEVRGRSERFNRSLLLTHSAAYGEMVPEDLVRAAMLIRLNTALFGGTGMQSVVVRQYAEFLNRGITPLMFGQGSVGEADITILPQIGLAMIGEGEVMYRGKRVPAAQALRQAGLAPIRVFGKDGLSIVSSNAYSAALASLGAVDARTLLDQADAVAALSLEALDGNLAPILPGTQAQRPFDGQSRTAERMTWLLRGSSLWEKDAKRPLQDPLSFRTVSQVHGSARDMLALLESQLAIQINSSDDNPTVVLDAEPPADASSYVLQFYVKDGPVRGAVLPSAGFDPSAWALPLQAVSVALSQVAQLSAQRTLRLSDPTFTRLTRYLSPGGEVIGYATIQKTVSSLAAEMRTLSSPVTTDVLVTSGNIEDVGTNAPVTAHRILLQLRRLTALLGVETLHAAQAVDLRQKADSSRVLGAGTLALWLDFRRAVPFLSEDRRNDLDIERASSFLLQSRDVRPTWAAIAPPRKEGK